MSDTWRDNIVRINTNVLVAINNRSLGLKGWNSKQGALYHYADRTVTTQSLENEKFQLPPRTRTTFITAFSPNGRLLASCHGDHNTHILDVKTKKHIKSLSGHERSPWCVAFHPGIKDILATGSLNGEVRVWDLRADASESYIVDQEENVAIASLSFHPYDHVLAIAAGNEIHFWDWSLPRPFASVKTNNPEIEKVRLVRFDPWGHSIITGVGNPEDEDEEEPTFDHWSWLIPPSSRSRRPGGGEVRASTRRRMSRRFAPEPDNSPAPEQSRGLNSPRQPEHFRPRRRSSRFCRRPRDERSLLADQSQENGGGSDGWMRYELGRPRSNLSETHQRILHARVSVNAEIRQQYTRLQMLRQERQRLEMRLRELQNSANEVRNSTPMLLNPSTDTNEATDQRRLVSAPYERSIANSTRDRQLALERRMARETQMTLENLQRESLRREEQDPTAMEISFPPPPRTYTELNNIRPGDRPGFWLNMPDRMRNYPMPPIESYSQPRIAPYVSFPRSFDAYGPTSPESPTLSDRRERITERFRRLRQNFLRNLNPRSSPTLLSQSDNNSDAVALTNSNTSANNLPNPPQPLNPPISSSSTPIPPDGSTVVSNSELFPVPDISHRQSILRSIYDTEFDENGIIRPYALLELARRSREVRASANNSLPTSETGGNYGTFPSSRNSVNDAAVTQPGASSNNVAPSLVNSTTEPHTPSSSSAENRLLSLAISAERLERNDASQANRDEIMEIDIPDVQSSVTLETTGNNERYIDFENSVRRSDIDSQFLHSSNSNIQMPSSEGTHLLQPFSSGSSLPRAVPTSCDRTGSTTTSVDRLGPDTTSEHESLRMLSRANLIRRVESRPNRIGPASSSNNPPSLDEWLSVPSPDEELFNIPSPPTSPPFPDPPQYSNLTHDQGSAISFPGQSLGVNLPSTTPTVDSLPHGVTNEVLSSQSSSGLVASSLSTSAGRRLENVQRSQSPTSILMAAMDESESASSQSSTRNPSPVTVDESMQPSGLGSSAAVTARPSGDSTFPDEATEEENSPLSTAQSLSEAVDSLIQATDSLTEAADTLLREATTSASNLIAEEFSQSPDGSPEPLVPEDANSGTTSRSTPITTSSAATSTVIPDYDPYGGTDDYPWPTSTDSSRTLGVFHYGRDYATNRFDPRPPGLSEPTNISSSSRSTMTTSRLMRPSDTSWRSAPPRRRGLHHRELRSWLTSRSRGTVRRRDSESDSEDDDPSRPRLNGGIFDRNRDAVGNTASNPPLHRGQRTRYEASSSTGIRSNPRSRTHRQLRRTRNIMRTSINRIISTVYAENNGHQAVVLNIDSATYRLQHWDFTKLKLPEISRSDINVIVPHCKIYNDASVDISRDGRLLAALVPTFVGFPDNMMNVAVFSLQPKNFGQLLFKKAYGPNAVCLSISPLCNHICVGLKGRQFLLGESRPSRFLMAQVLEITKDQYCSTEMPVVRHICHPAREQQNRLVSINTIAWSPEVGGGLVYGTNTGDLRMCSIASQSRDSDDSDDNDMMVS